MVGVPEKLRAVRHAQSRGIGLRRACALWGVSRSMTGYSHILPVKDAPLVQTLVEVSRIHNTWGYRLVHGWVKGKVEGATIFRVRRLWKLHGLARPGRKRGRKLRTGARLKPLPTGPNAIWCMDFAEDRLLDGGKVFALLVKDEATAFGLKIAVAASFKGKDVEAILDQMIKEYGPPEYIRCDNGGQFIAFVVQRWAEVHGVKMAHIDPGKPWQNGSAESFVGTYRKEVLDAELFGSIAEAAWLSERWRRMYNQERPHSRLGYRPPATAYPVKGKVE
jgi:putative transposase